MSAAAASVKPSNREELLLSELHVTATKEAYEITCAAPNATAAEQLHCSVDPMQHVLRVSNASEPPDRGVVTFQVVRASVNVHAYPSSNAPVVGTKGKGERIRGHLPVHFWVELAQGGGWIRMSGGPSAELHVLGRPPLTADELVSEQSFSRYIRLPADADVDNCGDLVMHRIKGFFSVEVPRLAAPSPPPMEERHAQAPSPDAVDFGKAAIVDREDARGSPGPDDPWS